MRTDERIERGMLAVSRAGHDCGTVYVILRADEKFVWLSDGRQKPAKAPKKKSRKHIQVIKKVRVDLPETAVDEAVKYALKRYRKENQEVGDVESGCN